VYTESVILVLDSIKGLCKHFYCLRIILINYYINTETSNKLLKYFIIKLLLRIFLLFLLSSKVHKRHYVTHCASLCFPITTLKCLSFRFISIQEYQIFTLYYHLFF